MKTVPTAPRRSVIALFVAAEEQGLLGSQYFAEHPPVPPGKIAADINFDGGNVWGRTRDVTQVGRGKSSLDDVVTRIAALQGRAVKPDQFPDRGSFYRSDQFNFAKIGVPALYMKTGTDFVGRPQGWGTRQILDYEAHRYHQPSDELRADWNFDDEAPTWRAGDEFEAVRKAALGRAMR